MKTYSGAIIKINAFKRGGYFILRISNYKTYYAATRSGKAVIESAWMPEYEIKFENKTAANNYFKAIRKNNPDLKLIADEPNKYIRYDGTVKSY